MAYNSRHSIFLQDNDKQKLVFIKSLFDKEGLCFVVKEETVYQYDGEPLTVTSLSDINWNYGDGYVWHDFETDMERISEKFNRKYPNDAISVYVKTEDGFENLYEFQDGSLSSDEDKSYGIGNDAAAIRGHRHCKPSYYCLPLWRIYFHRL